MVLATIKFNENESDKIQSKRRACYVTGSHHLFLTPQHLSTWAASIEHNLATIDTPPSFPIFANKTVRSNQSNSQPLPPQASILQHTLFSYTITMYPYSTSQVALPSQFAFPSQAALSSPFQAALSSPSRTALSSQTPAITEKSIPKIDEFLQKLDN
ncbi:hypothetical protein RhiirC2_870976 [Rhizophagus irregularis]|uniref:Uncharacterized protein n=1 Tax=Rhizophagus irregularis TaxID=588596 RepID=A0A2N1MFD3_9GLOM|nr:hypothetical protein RhiirC2_870976 [Rhizophagus irregularis]